MIISPENKKWLDEFHREHGRAPRVLHIGNIANNAYLNAKLLNKAGLDCDVICYNYYHIMGCPEWEDADFDEGEIKDQFFPNWGLVNLNGFKRPRWFVQGPLRFCMHYLISKQDRKNFRALFWWNVLNISRFLLCVPTSIFLLDRLRVVRNRLCAVRDRLFTMLSYRPVSRNMSYFVRNQICFLTLILYSIFGLVFNSLSAFVYLSVAILKLVNSLFNSPFPQLISPMSTCHKEFSFEKRMDYLIEVFTSKFPERGYKLITEDMEDCKSSILYWRKLFSRYDIVQAYSTDPIIPLLADIPYFAFEHGTLREIPFQQNGQGRRTAISYNLAEHVFVTNADCLVNARKLVDDSFTFINHPYDEDHGLNREGWQCLRQELLEKLKSNFLFFFPTRHDWVPGTGYADKANDIFLRSFVNLRNNGYMVGMVCCQWGFNTQQSEELIKVNNCSDYVHWVEPMGIVRFERMANACDIVVDQFKLGSFGGVLFKAMANGSPVCTYLDETQMHAQYADIPPVVNCKTEEEIITRMRKIIEDPSVLEDMSEASRKWVKKHYASAETVNAQLSRYKKYFYKHKII